MTHTHVRMKTVACGPDFSASPGDLLAADHPRAQDLLEGGHADPVTITGASSAARREKAVAPTRETRTPRAQAGRKADSAS